MNTGKFVIMLTSLVVMALLVGAVFLPVVSSSATRTVTTIEENEEPGWSRYAYTQTDDYSFGISIEDDTLNIGSQTLGIQTGELYDMMVLSTDMLSIMVNLGGIFLITEEGVVDLGTSVNVEKTSSGLTVGESTYPAPLWSYYPSATGKYAYFDHADLLTDGKPISAWGSFAGVYAYSQFTYPDYELVMDATVTDGVIEGANWGIAPDTLDIQPFNPGDVIFNPIDLNPIDVDLEPIDLGGGENQIMSADPVNGTRVGDLYYTFSGTDATVIGYASTIDWNTFTTIPDTVVSDNTTYNITSIGSYAFNGCTTLALTSLPDGVTSIGSYAFQNCTNLALTSLPDGVTSINQRTFQGCTNLALTSLPDGVTSIGSNAFQYCTTLALTSLPDGVTSIGGSAFNGCTNLALTSLPDGVTSIGSIAFAGCTNLALTSLPDGVTSIGNSAFQNCTNLALTSLPDGVTSIGSSAFEGCTNLAITYVNASLGQNVFKGCTGIPYLVLDCDGKSVDSFIISGTTFTDMVIVGNPNYATATIFTGSNLEEVLNIGGGDSSGRGFGTATVQDYIDASGYIAPLGITHHEQVMIESPTTDVINILPLVAGIGLLLIGLGVFITRRI